MDGWRAKPHQWGVGKVHWIDDSVVGDDRLLGHTDPDARTLCGKLLNATPGILLRNPADRTINCLICRNKIVNREIQARRREQYEREAAQREAETAERNAAWWARYDAYLKSPEWLDRWRLVMKRANRICEGCAKNPATIVHHLTYIRVFREMLFDLVAVCRECHDEIHQKRSPQQRRQA